MNDKDQRIIEKIVAYCEQSEQACFIFGNTLESFLGNAVFQNACCMCILQIGELAGKLSDEAKAKCPDVPWREIRGMRNICAHNYGRISPVSTWHTIQEDIPALKAKCQELLKMAEE